MATVMASRFSVLKIEDDSDQEREKAARKKASEEEKAKKKNLTKKKKKAKPAETLDAELASMAFGMPKPKQQAKQKKGAPDSPRKTSVVERQEWEKRDQVLVDDTFEKDLQQAMLQSKVDFEERQSFRVTDPAAADTAHRNKAGKKAKPNTVSLDQLQTLSSQQIDQRDFRHLQEQPRPPASPPAAAAAGGGEPEGDFFEHVERKTREAVVREKTIEEIRRSGPVRSDSLPSPATDEELRLRLALKSSEAEELHQELDTARDELKQAKSRTKRILGVLAQSETKEKVQLILAQEKAEAAREAADRERGEMAAQVTGLLEQLERERSKVHALTTQLKQARGNKRRGHSETDGAIGENGTE